MDLGLKSKNCLLLIFWLLASKPLKLFNKVSAALSPNVGKYHIRQIIAIGGSCL